MIDTDELIELIRRWGETKYPLQQIVDVRINFVDGGKSILRMPTPIPVAAVMAAAETLESTPIPEKLHQVEKAIIDVLESKTERVSAGDLWEAIRALNICSEASFWRHRGKLMVRGIVSKNREGYALIGND